MLIIMNKLLKYFSKQKYYLIKIVPKNYSGYNAQDLHEHMVSRKR